MAKRLCLLVLVVAAGAQIAGAAVSAGITSIPGRSWPRRRRPSTSRACAASRFRAPATADRSDRRSRTPSTSTGRAARWRTTRARSTGKPARARKRSTASPATIRRRGNTGSAGSAARRRRRTSRQTHIVNGRYAWHIDGSGAPVAVPPEMAEVYQLDVWLNPHGFLKAARMPGANPKALWRWEQIEKGRDGNVVDARKGARRRHHGARQIPRRRDHQQPEHHHAAQGDGERERAGRFQHRAGIDRVRSRRAVEVADQLALASGLGRQLAVLFGEHRPQRLRRQVPERAGQRLRRSRAGSGIGEAGAAAEPRAR